MQTFPEVLADYRKRSGLSQSDIARRAGLSASYVNRLESGDRQPNSRDLVLGLAKALSLSPDDTDRLLLSARYARESESLAEAHPLVGLVARLVSDDHVTQEQITLLEAVANTIDEQRRRAAEEPPKS